MILIFNFQNTGMYTKPDRTVRLENVLSKAMPFNFCVNIINKRPFVRMSMSVCLWWLYGLTALTKGDYLTSESSCNCSSDYQFDDQLFSFRFRETCFLFLFIRYS